MRLANDAMDASFLLLRTLGNLFCPLAMCLRSSQYKPPAFKEFYEHLFYAQKNILRRPQNVWFQHFGKASVHFTVGDLGTLSKCICVWLFR